MKNSNDNVSEITLGDFRKITKDLDDNLILYIRAMNENADEYCFGPVITLKVNKDSKYLDLNNFI